MQTDGYLALLEARKAYLERSILHIESALDREPPKDIEDRATEREDDEVLECLGNTELAELRQIRAAIARIGEGTFGVCTCCADPISAARLDVLPHTPLCRRCARAADAPETAAKAAR